MSKILLTPTGILIAEGKVSYQESAGAWSMIRLHSSILKEFPALKNKRAKISFKIEYPRTIKKLKSKIKDIRQDKEIPLLLYLYYEPPE
jgi:hypothetical protein